MLHLHVHTNIWLPTVEYQHLSTNIWVPTFELGAAFHWASTWLLQSPGKGGFHSFEFSLQQSDRWKHLEARLEPGNGEQELSATQIHSKRRSDKGGMCCGLIWHGKRCGRIGLFCSKHCMQRTHKLGASCRSHSAYSKSWAPEATSLYSCAPLMKLFRQAWIMKLQSHMNEHSNWQGSVTNEHDLYGN